MKLTTQTKLKILNQLEEDLNKLDKHTTYVGFHHLMLAKQQVWMLRTVLEIEEQLDENKVSE